MMSNCNLIPNFLPDYTLSLKRKLKAVAFFMLLLFAYRHESILKIQTHFLGTPNSDAGLYLWLFKSNLQDLFSLPWFNTKGFYPYTQTLAWSDNFILPSLLAWPFIKLGASVTVAYNAILLLANFLNGYLTFRFSFQISRHYLGSILAGTCFFSFPFLAMHLGHPQLQFAFWIPLALIYFFKAFNSQPILYSLLTGLTIFLSFLTSVYYTFFILVLLKLLFLALFLQKSSYFKLKKLSRWVLGFIFGIAPILFFAFPYLAVKETFGMRELKEAFSFRADGLSYLSSPVSSFFYNFSSKWTHPEAQLFPGLICMLCLGAIFYVCFKSKQQKITGAILSLLILAGSLLTIYQTFLAAMILWLSLFVFIFYLHKNGQLEKKLKINFISNRSLTLSLLFSLFTFYFISFGPLGKVNSITESPGLYSIYYYLFPGMASIRAIGRAGIVVVFIACALIPFALQKVIKGRYSNIICLSLILLAAVENYPRFYPLEPQAPASPVFASLSRYADKDGVTITLPLTKDLKDNNTVKSWGNFAYHNINYLNWLHDSGLNTVNGYSGQRSSNMSKLPGLLRNFPSKESVKTLSQIYKLKYVIFVPSYQEGFNKEVFEARYQNMPESLTLIEQDSFGNYLFALHATLELTPSMFFQMPSHPAGKTFEFALMTNSVEDTVEVKVHLKKHFEKTPYTRLTLPADSSWHWFKLPNPKTTDKVRPLFFNFKFNPKTSILIKTAQ